MSKLSHVVFSLILASFTVSMGSLAIGCAEQKGPKKEDKKDDKKAEKTDEKKQE